MKPTTDPAAALCISRSPSALAKAGDMTVLPAPPSYWMPRAFLLIMSLSWFTSMSSAPNTFALKNVSPLLLTCLSSNQSCIGLSVGCSSYPMNRSSIDCSCGLGLLPSSSRSMSLCSRCLSRVIFAFSLFLVVGVLALIVLSNVDPAALVLAVADGDGCAGICVGNDGMLLLLPFVPCVSAFGM